MNLELRKSVKIGGHRRLQNEVGRLPSLAYQGCVVAISKEIECPLVAACDLSASLCFL